MGTKSASESKPTTTAALGAKIRPDQKKEKNTASGLQWVAKLHRNQSQPQLQLTDPKIHLSTWAFHLVKNLKKRQVRGCRRNQNSTRSKKGTKHHPRAALGTKTASQSKPTTTAALGAQNPPLHMSISPVEKLKKTTGPRRSLEPKFDPIN